jgi:predicted DNA-binding transcriptional regulator YafY
MRRADRLFQIVQYLRGGRLTTAAKLAETLEVTPRTVYRDIADLIGSGVPIEGEAGVGYVMRDGYDLPPLMFTTEEIVALVAGARLIRAWGGAQMARGAEEALIKIETVLPDAARARAGAVPVHALQMDGIDDATRALLDRIEAATVARSRLEFTYEDETGSGTRRTVRPLGLWFWGKVWTMVAWCELREDFRHFRVDRILEAQEGARFRAEPGKGLRDFYAREDRLGHRAPDRGA